MAQVVVGPDITLSEGTVVSMHHPDEEEEEDEDEFLSDDADTGHSESVTKQKGTCNSKVTQVLYVLLCTGLCCVFYVVSADG